MASYIQGLSDNPQSFNTPLYQPDLNWLSGAMQKKADQYQQGVAQVASGYSAILNAPLTDEGNKVKRAEYLKIAQEGLKKSCHNRFIIA